MTISKRSRNQQRGLGLTAVGLIILLLGFGHLLIALFGLLLWLVGVWIVLGANMQHIKLKLGDERLGRRVDGQPTQWPRLDVLGCLYEKDAIPSQKYLGNGYFCIVPRGASVKVELEDSGAEKPKRRTRRKE